MNNRAYILCAVAVALVSFGCEKDSIEPTDDWELDAGSDGHLMEVGGTDADGGGLEDGGETDGSEMDGGGDADSTMPPEYSPDPAIPAQPASNTVCNDNQWCWLHPSPLPHSIDNLRSVDGQVYATAYDGAVQGRQPMVWDESGFELLEKPVATNQEIVDMTTTRNGWLALTPEGRLYDVGPNGVRDSVTLDGDGYRGLLGVSFDAYLAWESDREAHLRHDGEILEYNALPTDPTNTVMWDDGTLWGIAELRDDKRGFLSGDWVAYPEPSGFFGESVSAMGPSPRSDCVSAGFWIASDSGSAFQWDEFDARWNEVSHPGGQIQSIGCGTAATATAVDDQGNLLRWSGGEWSSESVARLAFTDFATAGGQTYLAGTYGTLATLSASQVDHASDGFRIPPSESPSYYGTGYHDIWVSADGNKMVLAHGSGLYMGTEAGWSKMATPGGAGSVPSSDAHVEFWGVNRPRFATIGTRLLRWDGSRWQAVDLPGSPSASPDGRDLAGLNTSEVWLATRRNLFFFDGTAWNSVSSDGAPVADFIEDRDLTLTAIEVADDGTPIVAASGALYELTGQQGNWQIQKHTSTPCENIRDLAVTDTQTYVAGFSGCVARKRQGSWTEYAFPPESEWPPTVFSPRAYELLTPGGDLPTLVATSVGLIALDEVGTTNIQHVGDFRDLSVSTSNAAVLALHRSGVVARYID